MSERWLDRHTNPKAVLKLQAVIWHMHGKRRISDPSIRENFNSRIDCKVLAFGE